MVLANRLGTVDWINQSNILELSADQRYLFVVLPNIADSNGCFESNPKMICSLTRTKEAELLLLFQIMIDNDLIIPYEVAGRRYWYLTKFLEQQRLRGKAKTPSPPWLYWEPENGSTDLSKGRYRVNYDKMSLPTATNTIDKKPPLEEKEEKEEKEENNNSGFAIASNNDDKQRFTQALKDVLDGSIGLRQTLNVDKLAAKHQIMMALKCNPEYKLNDLHSRFEIMPVDDDWQVYERTNEIIQR